MLQRPSVVGEIAKELHERSHGGKHKWDSHDQEDHEGHEDDRRGLPDAKAEQLALILAGDGGVAPLTNESGLDDHQEKHGSDHDHRESRGGVNTWRLLIKGAVNPCAHDL